MAKRSNHRTVVLLQDFAGRKAGEDFTADGMLTTSLVNRGIAENKKSITIELAPAETLDANVEFNPLPEVTEENNSSEKLSDPKESKPKSSSKTKSKK
jgi:hypothetical protein